MVNGKPVSGLLEFKPAADPSGYQSFTVSFDNPDAIASIDISLVNATPGRALHIKDFLINGVAVTPADATNASSPDTFDLYVRNIHVDTSNHQDWFIGALTDNDQIYGGAGDDVIDGGDGIDTAIFAGNIADYDVTIADGHLIVRDRIADRDGSDHLSNLEFLQFADGSGHLLTSPSLASAGSLQQAVTQADDGSHLQPNYASGGAVAGSTDGSAGGDTFIFRQAAGHDVIHNLSADDSIDYDVNQIDSAIAADATDVSVHVAGGDTVIELGQEASMSLTGVTSLAAGSLLFV